MRHLAMPLAIVALWTAAAGPAQAADPPSGKGWVEVETGNFTILANTNAKKARTVAIDLERFREVLGRATRGFEFESGIPTTVYLFRNDHDFEPYKLDDEGQPRNIAGYFFRTPFRAYVTLDASASSSHTRGIYHEFVHSLLRGTFHDLPLWLNEGLAEFYSTFRFNDLSNTAWIGDSIEEHRLQLAREKLMPLERFFAVTHGSPEYNESTLQGTFYAQSWLLTHYLIGTDEHRARLPGFLEQVRQGADARETLFAMLGTDEAGLRAALEKYLDEGSGNFQLTFPKDVERAAPTLRELDEATVLIRLGDLLAHREKGQAAAARAHLEAARAAGADAGRLDGLLGYLAERDGDDDAARRAYRSAIATDAGDRESLTRLGKSLLKTAWDELSFDPPAELPAEVGEARALFRRVLEDDKSNVEALIGMGATYLFDREDFEVGSRLLAAAATLDPQRTDSVVQLVMLLASRGHPDAAQEVLQTQLRDADPGTIRHLTDWVTHGRRAADRARAGAEGGTAAEGDAAAGDTP